MCRIRWPAFLALLLVLLLVPAPAMADETDVLGGFGRGFSDLVAENEVEDIRQDPPLLGATRGLPTEIRSVINSFNTVDIHGTQRSWLNAIRQYFGAIYSPVRVAIALVFFWWGLRRTKNIIVRVFKGKKFRL